MGPLMRRMVWLPPTMLMFGGRGFLLFAGYYLLSALLSSADDCEE